ncbi:MAG: S-layer homology domain-containing protein [Oscillospiraceae bacterium]|nr:S-layer homology domain-containing protein [Oscillospiraceae bacterium]
MVHRTKRFGAIFLILAILFASIPALAAPYEAVFELGNSPINSLNGGKMAQAGDDLYWADETGIYLDDTRITTEPGANLNVMGGGLYYTLAGDVTLLRRIALPDGAPQTILEWNTAIDQLYITGDSMALLLSEEQVYRANLQDGEILADETAFSVTGFIPTAHGTIYAAGYLGNFTLFADDQYIESGVTNFFTEEDFLILRRGISDYQVAIDTLFTTGGPAVIAPYSLGDIRITPWSHSAHGGEDCPTCAEALEDFLAGIVYDPIITPLHVTTHTLPLTQSQQNVVKRARQMAEIRWTPLQNITGWRGNMTYYAGQTVVGIPYAQPVTRGRYIPWQATLSTFAAAVQDINSVMYTSFSFNGTHATRAPYFGTDCSGFVSWALEHPVRTHTGSFPNHAQRITQNLYALQVGDVFNASHHNKLVTAVEFDANGNLVAVEIMDQSIPTPRLRRWGAGGNAGNLQTLIARTFQAGFALYRSNTIGNVSFTPDPAVDVGLGQRHTISASAGPGGTVTPAGYVNVMEGADQTFVFMPNQGFAINRVWIDGVDVGPLNQVTFPNVTTDHTVSVEFVLTGSPFSDVREGSWYHPHVLYVFEHGLMNGTSQTTFEPHTITTRNMFVTILGRMAEIDPLYYAHTGIITGSVVNHRAGPGTNYAIIGSFPRDTSLRITGARNGWFQVIYGTRIGYVSGDFFAPQPGTHPDVAPGRFYTSYVEWASRAGIVLGTGDGNFLPADSMTRQEMAVFLHRYSTAMGITLQQDTSLPLFHDLNTVAPWARDAVIALQRAGIIQGAGDGSFDPLGHSDRASVTSMIANFHRIYG